MTSETIEISIVTPNTDYNILEKCYSIWICRDNIPTDKKYSISKYKFVQTLGSNANTADYELMELIIICLGKDTWDGGDGLFDFLNLIFYPHKKDFQKRFGKYIDLSLYDDLRKETRKMSGLGEAVFQDGKAEGLVEGRSLGFEEGINIIAYIGANPSASDEDIAKEIGCDVVLVSRTRAAMNQKNE